PEDELGSWYMLFGKHEISDTISINTGMQFRYYEVISNYNLNLFYTGINYHFNSNTYFTFNYGYLDIDHSIEFTDIKNTIEHRFWEQIYHRHQLGSIPLNHRVRLEHRFLHLMDENTIQNRIRYRIGTKLPFNKTFGLVINNEFLLNLEGEAFRENRAYAAIETRFSKTFQLQLGYMKQHINGLKLDRLQFGLYVFIDWRKKP
ncbi:MAG: DUF2490 domain-containing protein, partial [Psychroserpens sp.]|nr:DUF2490 domain-containing protein [Psychroserpens sp.]